MHSLSPYSVRVFNKALPGPMSERYHQLDDVRSKDLLDVIYDFASSKQISYQEVDDESGPKTIKFSDVSRSGRTVSGLIEYGEYGIKGKVVNVKSGDTVYRKGRNDSDIRQLYFNFTIPVGESVGVCLFHNVHGRGIKTLCTTLLNDYAIKLFEDLHIQIRPLAYEEAIKDWLEESQVKKIRLTRYHSASGVKDEVDKLTESAAEVTLKPKALGGHFGKLSDFMRLGKKKAKNSDLVDILSEECESVKAIAEHEGRQRVFTLTSNTTPVGSIEFDDGDVEMEDGVPKLSSLHAFSQGLVQDISHNI